MPTVDTILKDIQRLHTIEKEEILNYLEEILVFRVYSDKVADEVKENRFSRGKVCPHCGFEHISRNGKYNGRQPIFV